MRGRVYKFSAELISLRRAEIRLEVDNTLLENPPDMSKEQWVTIETKKKKRSLDANAYMWALADKIARKIYTTKEAVYQRAIRDVGVFDTLAMTEEAYQRFRERWKRKGVGWVTDIADSNGRMVTVLAYYGSSTYTTDEMARLIDWMIDEAEGMGIDTLTPNEKSKMLKAWEESMASDSH